MRVSKNVIVADTNASKVYELPYVPRINNYPDKVMKSPKFLGIISLGPCT